MSVAETSKIAHAIAYCDMYLTRPSDPGQDSEFETIVKYKNHLSTDEVVLIIKEIAERDENLPESDVVVREIETKTFKKYISQRLMLGN